MRRPSILVADCSTGKQVVRPMDDEEFEAHKTHLEEYRATPKPDHALIEQIKSMSKSEKARLKKLLG